MFAPAVEPRGGVVEDAELHTLFSGAFESQAKTEVAAAPFDHLRIEPAVHALQQLRDNGQAQPAAVIALRSAVATESLQQVFELLGINADASVGHAEAQLHAVSGGSWITAHFETDLAVRVNFAAFAGTRLGGVPS